MDILSWSIHNFRELETKKRLYSDNILNLLKEYNCSDLKELIRKGKEGNVKTTFTVQNWDTLIWDPEDFSTNRPAVCFGMVSLDNNLKESIHRRPDIVQCLKFGVVPTKEDPNFYSFHIAFRGSCGIHLASVGCAKRLSNYITGMSNGVYKFKLGGELDIFNHDNFISDFEQLNQVLSGLPLPISEYQETGAWRLAIREKEGEN